jgi:hypothetical protein
MVASKSLARRRFRLSHARVSIEPREGSLNNPSPREELEAGRVSGALDDLNRPVAEFGKGITQVGAIVDTVSEEVAQPGKQLVDGLDDKPGTMAILDIGSRPFPAGLCRCCGEALAGVYWPASGARRRRSKLRQRRRAAGTLVDRT